MVTFAKHLKLSIIFSDKATKTTDSLKDPVEVKAEVKADSVKSTNGAVEEGKQQAHDVKNDNGGDKASRDGQSK